MTRRYDQGKRGERLVCKAPGRPRLSLPPCATIALPRFCCLTARDIVVIGNVAIHKVAGVREAVEARGATFIYLPPLNPRAILLQAQTNLASPAARSIECLRTNAPVSSSYL
jgi:hypothetical protein